MKNVWSKTDVKRYWINRTWYMLPFSVNSCVQRQILHTIQTILCKLYNHCTTKSPISDVHVFHSQYLKDNKHSQLDWPLMLLNLQQAVKLKLLARYTLYVCSLYDSPWGNSPTAAPLCASPGRWVRPRWPEERPCRPGPPGSACSHACRPASSAWAGWTAHPT